ncbi:MAG: glycosyltransferase [Cyanobacteria bacterium P01_D01_bin.105]
MSAKVDAYLQLGQRYHRQSKLAEAIHAYQKAVFYGYREVWLLEAIGDLASEIGHWSDAIASYQTALSIAPDHADLCYKTGRALAQQHRHMAAVEMYRAAIALQPDFVDAHFWMGNAFCAMNALSEAIAAYTQVTVFNSAYRKAYENLAAIFTAQNNAAGVAFCNRHTKRLSEQPPEEQTQQPISEYSPENKLADSIELRYSNRLKTSTSISSSHLSPSPSHRDYSALVYTPNNGTPNIHRTEEEASKKALSGRSAHYFQIAQDLFDAAQYSEAIAFYKIAQKLAPQDFRIAFQLQRSVEAFHRTNSGQNKRRLQPEKQPKNSKQNLPQHDEKPERMPIGKNNDYTFITQKVKAFVRSQQPYHLPVSIIIPTYNRKDKLAKMLAALTHQSYPSHLIEIIVADDGSSDGIETVIQKYQPRLRLRHARQPDEGFRLAKVCNLGLSCAQHENIILLQCDMLPTPQLVEAYMQYLHVSKKALLIGTRQFVNADEISDDQILRDMKVALNLPEIKTQNEMWKGRKSWQDWRIAVYEQTDDLKAERYPYRAVVGSNLAFAKQMVREIGDFSEDFQAWGGEDREFGYRAYNAGYYFIPVKTAQGLHQEPPGGVNESDRKQGQKLAEAGCEEKCPLPLERKYQPHRIYEVPKVSIYILAVGVLAFDQTARLEAVIESVLNQTYTDLEVCVLVGEATGHQNQQSTNPYAANPRVRWVSSATKTGAASNVASNVAFKQAKGAYVGYLRLGDSRQLTANAVETLVNYLDNHDDGCACSGDPDNPFRLFRKRDWMRAAGFAEPVSYDSSFANYSVEKDMLLQLSAVCSFGQIDKSLYAPYPSNSSPNKVSPHFT